jgi:hypothetical protein
LGQAHSFTISHFLKSAKVDESKLPGISRLRLEMSGVTAMQPNRKTPQNAFFLSL